MNWTKQLSKHKFFEIELYLDKGTADYFLLSLSWSKEQDHAGPRFEFLIYKIFQFCIKIYDNRHWNWDTNNWYTKEEAEVDEKEAEEGKPLWDNWTTLIDYFKSNPQAWEEVMKYKAITSIVDELTEME